MTRCAGLILSLPDYSFKKNMKEDILVLQKKRFSVASATQGMKMN